MKYDKLFSRGKIGKLLLKNRVVMPSMGTILNLTTGEISDHEIAYFEERAKGGVGLIITEFTPIDPLGKSGISHPRVDGPKFIPMLSRLADTVHKYDAKIFMQLSHAGRETFPDFIDGNQPVAPSPIPCGLVGETPRELTLPEIKVLIGKFINGAMVCKQAKMDGIELHGAHGYLINQFISPKTNKRTDEYGGSFEGRLKFVKEIVEGIKQMCGNDFPVSVRLSIDEFAEGGIQIELGVAVAKFLESIGVDVINVSSGIYESFDTVIEPITYDQGWRAYLAEAVKKEVHIPVIAVGVIREPDFAEQLLQDNKTDFVAIGRGHIADPHWCKKAQSGRESEIRRCISCLYCADEVLYDHIRCAVNAKTGRELEFKSFRYDGDGRKVVIIGGGPGGMEAARVLAKRNFNVVLFEKETRLGGQLNYGSKPPGKAKMLWLLKHLSSQLMQLEVDLRLGVQADIDTVKAEDPYATFVATGASAIIPKVEGIDKDLVCLVQDVLGDSDAFSEQNVAIIGAGMTGCETARLLASQGCHVALVEMLSDIGTGAGLPDKLDIVKRMKKEDIEIFTDHRLLEVKNSAILVEDMKAKRTSEIKVDRVVLSTGMRPNCALYDQLYGQLDNLFLLGDAVSPRRIGNAIQEGFEKAFVLE